MNERWAVWDLGARTDYTSRCMLVPMKNLEMKFADITDEMAALAVMNQEGDTKYVWDPENPDEVQAAKEKFREMKKEGFLIFRIGKEAKRFSPKSGGYFFVSPEEASENEAVVGEVEVQKGDRFLATPPVAGG